VPVAQLRRREQRVLEASFGPPERRSVAVAAVPLSERRELDSPAVEHALEVAQYEVVARVTQRAAVNLGDPQPFQFGDDAARQRLDAEPVQGTQQPVDAELRVILDLLIRRAEMLRSRDRNGIEIKIFVSVSALEGLISVSVSASRRKISAESQGRKFGIDFNLEYKISA